MVESESSLDSATAVATTAAEQADAATLFMP